MDIVDLILRNLQIVIAVLLFVVGWYFGTMNERRHLARLADEERLFAHISISNERFYVPAIQSDGALVLGGVSIAQDRFKLIFAGFLSLFGKNLTVYESLLERARREAVLRMKRQANELGCVHIYGVRIETSTVDGGGVEVLVYGTAV